MRNMHKKCTPRVPPPAPSSSSIPRSSSPSDPKTHHGFRNFVPKEIISLCGLQWGTGCDITWFCALACLWVGGSYNNSHGWRCGCFCSCWEQIHHSDRFVLFGILLSPTSIWRLARTTWLLKNPTLHTSQKSHTHHFTGNTAHVMVERTRSYARPKDKHRRHNTPRHTPPALGSSLAPGPDRTVNKT